MKSIFTLLWRDLRGGELTILVFSLLLATATVTSISLFTNRIQNSILDEAAEFLAADAQIRSSMPINESWQLQAQQQGLATANLAGFRAMAFSESGMQLVAVKAASSGYPLKGALSISNIPFGKSSVVSSGPVPGEAWLASRLFSALNLSLGETISIGDASFIVTQVLIKEPDSPQSFFGVAPRVIIHYDDIDKTNAVQTGSRVNHTLLVAGDKSALKRYKSIIENELGNHARWVGVEEGNRNVGDALQRAEKFLLLAGSLSVMLCGIAIALAARRYAARQATNVALLKTFGQTPNQITQRYLIVLLLLGVTSVTIGAISGWLLHLVILSLLSNLLPEGLSPASINAFFTGAISGMVTLFAFAAPPLLSLRHVPPAAVLRQDTNNGITSPRTAAIIGIVSLCFLLYGYSNDWLITGLLIAGSLAILIGGSALAWLVLTIAKKLSKKASNAWRLAVANLKRHQGFNAVQIVIFSTLIMLLLVLIDTRTSLITQWQQQIPTGAPNHFLFNIFNDEKPQIDNLLQLENIHASPFYPMLRGRLIEVNDTSIKPRVEQTSSHMNYERELNLTWASTLGSDNRIISGKWHAENNNTIEVSAEEEYAKGIHLNIGDKLLFSIAGETVTATLTSIRSVQWDSMNPNFFMIFNQPLLDNTATNWLTSMYLPADKKSFLNKLSTQFPTVSIIELEQMLDQVKGIIQQVSLAVEFILVLVLVAGILVLITSIQATLDIRFQESAILRTLGAKRSFVNKVLVIEFCTLGLMAGILGAIGAQLCLYLLQTRVFDLDFSPSPLSFLLGPAAGTLLIGTIGWLSTRKVTRQPPLTTLRDLQ